jgi:hypothetical protein
MNIDQFNIHIKPRLIRQPGCTILAGGETLTGRAVYTQYPAGTTGLAVIKSAVVRVKKIDDKQWEIERSTEAIA